jgi:hypothetical protein
MNEDYLWDRTGNPDDEVVRLERLLGQLRWREARTYVTPVTRPVAAKWWALAAAAILVTGVVTAVTIHLHLIGGTNATGRLTSWQLSFADRKSTAVRTGQTIDTSDAVSATIKSEFVGEIDVERDSRIRVLSAHDDQQRFALDHGVIHALIWAPPSTFVVDTPSAKTVDLGCQYTLRVALDGTGFLTVEIGWVAFQWHQVESFIPAGAACTTRPRYGPETPYFLDAPAGLTQALRRFDTAGDWDALAAALPLARQRDGLTLWHLLQRTKGAQRGEVFDRFAALVRLPPAVTREAILRGDQQAIDAGWNALELGPTTWWRVWKRHW